MKKITFRTKDNYEYTITEMTADEFDYSLYLFNKNRSSFDYCDMYLPRQCDICPLNSPGDCEVFFRDIIKSSIKIEY